MKKIAAFLILSLFISLSCSKQIKKNLEENDLKISPEAIQKLESAADLNILIEDVGDAKIVLLGEATHGTSEFYTWRAEISKRLIVEKGFDIIAVEADWEDAYAVNQYIKGNSKYPSAVRALNEFDRWPQWMWKNQEIAVLAEWLKQQNISKPVGEKIGFYGLDVYGIWESLDALVAYLDKVDPATAEHARQVVNCFKPFNKDEQAYAAFTRKSSENCADELAILLNGVQQSTGFNGPLHEEAFRAFQNLKVLINAENYYRTAALNYPLSWNVRDHHMVEILNNLIEQQGQETKIIVWEHNTHVGDARATDMAKAGMVNLGQLVREQYSAEEVYIVGFGTYKGKVIAATSWGAPPQVMTIPAARRKSWEWILHNHEATDKIVFTNRLNQKKYTDNFIGHRAIGVVYDPEEESGNYVPTKLPQRYDAFIFIDNSRALQFLK